MISKKRERKTENYLQVRKVDSKDLHKDKQSETQETDQSGEAERKSQINERDKQSLKKEHGETSVTKWPDYSSNIRP